MIEAEFRSAAIDSNKGTGIRPGSLADAREFHAATSASRNKEKTSRSDSVPLMM